MLNNNSIWDKVPFLRESLSGPVKSVVQVNQIHLFCYCQQFQLHQKIIKKPQYINNNAMKSVCPQGFDRDNKMSPIENGHDCGHITYKKVFLRLLSLQL